MVPDILFERGNLTYIDVTGDGYIDYVINSLPNTGVVALFHLLESIKEGKITQEDVDSKFVIFSPQNAGALIWDTFPPTSEGWSELQTTIKKMKNIHHMFSIPPCSCDKLQKKVK